MNQARAIRVTDNLAAELNRNKFGFIFALSHATDEVFEAIETVIELARGKPPAQETCEACAAGDHEQIDHAEGCLCACHPRRSRVRPRYTCEDCGAAIRAPDPDDLPIVPRYCTECMKRRRESEGSKAPALAEQVKA